MSDSRIVLQRWIGGNSIISNYGRDEVRIGSGIKDDLAVSEAVMPQITPAHCTILRQGNVFVVRRNGSAGVVLVNGRVLQAREEVAVTAADRVVLGSTQAGAVLEFRVLDPAFLAKLRQSTKGKEDSSDTVWLG
jgi:predicted component of type VI protein secretion system